MVFLNPIAFWGLFFLLVPIIVHFFDFRRAIRIDFSNVSFLQFITTESTPKSQLKKLLLLLTRCAAIIFIICAFAWPIASNNTRIANESGLIIFDNTFSLSDRCGDEPCLDQSKKVLATYANEFGSGLLTYPSAIRPKYYYDSEELLSILQTISYNKSDFNLNQIDPSIGIQIVVSDFQNPIVKMLQSETYDSIRFLLFPLSRETKTNLFIDSVYVENRFAFGEQRQTLIVKVLSSGEQKSDNVLFRLLNGNRQVSSLAIDVEADQSSLLEFKFDPSSDPTFELRLDDNAFEIDNRFFFTVPSTKKLKICIVNAKPNKSISAVFDNRDYFELHDFDESNIDFDQVFDADLVLFHAFKKIPDWAEIERIKGSVAIIPSEAIDLQSYSNFLGIQVRMSGDTTKRELLTNGLKHPFFDGLFEKLDTKSAMPIVSGIYHLSGVADPLLSTNVPFLQLIDKDGRKVYWFNGPLDARYSTLTNHALFLPIMYRIAEKSIGIDKPLFARLSDRPITLSGIQRSTEIVLLKGANSEFVPEVYYNQSDLSLTLPDDLNEPGLYYLMAGTDTLDILGLNIPKRESLVNWNDADDLREIFKNKTNVSILDTNSLDTLRTTLSELKDGRPFWKYALLLALMFLVAEIAIHRWLK